FTSAQRAKIATEYDGYATGLENVADDLASQGYDIAAGIQRDLASDYRNVADAARSSSSDLSHALS
ncbi:hypothetical protein, partial [Klebsiella pneumoniae]|uniref:hypothetical protein n=1 Tax=Klebsiella pneumoniae TaxID=573 RepID=UPI0025A113A5